MKLKLILNLPNPIVISRGATIILNFYDANWKRIAWIEESYKAGSSEWYKVDIQKEKLPDKTNHLVIELYLAQAKGDVWFDDVELSVTVMQKHKSKR